MGDQAKAADYYRQALQEAASGNSPRYINLTCQSLAEHHRRIGQVDSCIYFAHQAIDVVQGDLVVDVDWDFVKFRTEHRWWSGACRLDLADPSGFGRAAFAPVLERGASLEGVLEEMEREDPPRQGEHDGGTHHGDRAEAQTDADGSTRPDRWERRWN